MNSKQKRLKKAAAWVLSMIMMVSMAPASLSAADFSEDAELLAAGAAFSDGSQESASEGIFSSEWEAPSEPSVPEEVPVIPEEEPVVPEDESTFSEIDEIDEIDEKDEFEEMPEEESAPSETEIPDESLIQDEEIFSENLPETEELPVTEENVPAEEAAENADLYMDGFDDEFGTEELLGADSSYAGYTYKVSGGSAIITGYTGSSATLNIPSSIGGYPVTEIKSGAFADNTTITSAVIPSTVTWIGGINSGSKGAFQGCSRLQTVTIKAGSEDAEIRENTFKDCRSLTSVTIPGNYKRVAYRAFYNCTSLKTMEYKASGYSYANQTIDEGAFTGCTALTTAVIPRTVVSIGYYAFENCPNLTSVTLNEGLEKIGAGAFADDIKLPSITIPSTVTWIGGINSGSLGAFKGCSKLKTVTIKAGSEDAEIRENTFKDCTSLTAIVVPGNYTRIAYRAFYNCTALKTMEYKASSYSFANQTIDEAAFTGCTALTTAVIPRTVVSIGYYAFENCPNLTSVTLNEGLEKIGAGAFADDIKLPSITIPSTVTWIGGINSGSLGAFKGCSKLKTVTIKAGSEDAEIRENTFKDCTSLTAIVVPGNYTRIAYRAFYNCTALKTMEYKASSYSFANQTIDEAAFTGCTALTTAVIPRTVVSIGYYAFENCPNLTSVTLNEGLEKIGAGAFADDIKLPSITIPSTVTWIGGINSGSLGAFKGCSKLKTVTIKAGSEDAEIRENTFKDCTSLTAITIPGNYKRVGYRSFYNCTALKTMEYKASSYSFANQTIDEGAFEGCAALTKAVIPRTVVSIGDYAFNNCASLTSLTMNTGLETIGRGAFAGNVKLVSVTIPSTVTCIGGPNSGSVGAFAGCTSLITVKISDNTNNDEGFRLGYNTFRDCPSLTYVYIPASYTDLQGSNIFSGHGVVLSIWGKSGSTAQSFADANNIPFNRYPFTLKAPSVTAKNTVSNIAITWKTVENAVSYTIRRKTGTGPYVQIASTTGTGYTDKNVVLGYTYTYEIKAVNCGIPASPATFKVAHLPIEISKCKITLSAATYTYNGSAKEPSVTVKDGTATLVNGTDYTLVYSNNTNAGTASVKITGKGNYTGTATKTFTIAKAAQTLTTSITATSFTVGGSAVVTAKGIGTISYTSSDPAVVSIDKSGNVKGLKAGKATLKVTAAGDSNRKAASKSVNVTVTLATPALSSISNGAGYVTIKWKSIKGAAGYYIYRKTGSDGWKKIGKTSKTSYSDTSVKSGTTYTYTVQAYYDNITGKYSSAGKKIKYLARPSVSSAANAASGITVKWKKVNGAAGYYIYRKTGSGKWTKIASVSSSKLSYTDTKVKSKSGTVYSYTVSAYSGSYMSKYTNGKTICRMASPVISKASNSATKKITVKWNKNSAATGYQICYKTGSNKKTITVKGASALTKTLTGLTKGKTYTITVRSYKTVSGKTYYSAWSTAKKVKVTK
ncbi:MAG: leucine-rich repeat protein [Eubacteriales bacterium]|nr:leucine-rich repeat protein [Eubacteriales bacterium]